MPRALAMLALALVPALTACGRYTVAPPPERYRDAAVTGLPAGVQGSRSDLVFASEHVSRFTWAEQPELNRRDTLVNIRTPRALTAADEWPTDYRPSLDRARYLYLRQDTSGRDVLYFQDPGSGPHGRRGNARGYRGGY